MITLENSEVEEPVVIENGESATWASGENIVTIKVTDGTSETVYTVTVTKSE